MANYDRQANFESDFEESKSLSDTAVNLVEVKCRRIWLLSGVTDKKFHGRIWPLSGVMGFNVSLFHGW